MFGTVSKILENLELFLISKFEIFMIFGKFAQVGIIFARLYVHFYKHWTNQKKFQQIHKQKKYQHVKILQTKTLTKNKIANDSRLHKNIHIKKVSK